MAELLTTQGEGGAAYLAQERVVGELDGRDGQFVLQHGAAGGDGQDMRQWAFVVAGLRRRRPHRPERHRHAGPRAADPLDYELP